MRQDERVGGWIIEDQFANLCTVVRLAAHQREQQDPASAAVLRRAHGHMVPLVDDTMSLFGVLLRAQLDFQRRLAKELDDGLWFQFSRQDVEFFFLIIRSALDHVAGFVVSAAKTPQWVEKSSFDDLRMECRRDKAVEVLGDDWVRLVRSCNWFDDLRAWRVSLAHHGAMTLTFFDAETIPFQIHHGGDRKVSVPEIMYNELVVDFTRFAALYMSYLICLLEDMVEIGRRYLDIGRIQPAHLHAGGGVEVLRIWSDRLIALGTSPDSPS